MLNCLLLIFVLHLKNQNAIIFHIINGTQIRTRGSYVRVIIRELVINIGGAPHLCPCPFDKKFGKNGTTMVGYKMVGTMVGTKCDFSEDSYQAEI